MSRRSRDLSSVSYTALRRATPAENVRLGFTPKARHYVKASVKRVTKNTPSLSARAYETKRSKALYGVTPERATKERASNPLLYKSAQSRDAAEKTKRTYERKRETKLEQQSFDAQFLKRIERDAVARLRISKAAGKRKGQASFIVNRITAVRALENRRKRLRGEHIPDGEYQQMMDYMAHYNDPYYELMRGSPDIKGSRIAAK
jgi:hypothetical protein